MCYNSNTQLDQANNVKEIAVKPQPPDPYCAFKDDRERRFALVVREVCLVARSAFRAACVVGAFYIAQSTGIAPALFRSLRGLVI